MNKNNSLPVISIRDSLFSELFWVNLADSSSFIFSNILNIFLTGIMAASLHTSFMSDPEYPIYLFIKKEINEYKRKVRVFFFF